MSAYSSNQAWSAAEARYPSMEDVAVFHKARGAPINKVRALLMNVQMLLLVMAFVSFIAGLADYHPMTATRCISLGLALLTLAQLIR